MFLLSGQPLKARDNSVFHHLDWWTCMIYVFLVVFGWFSVCGASYVFGETEIFSFDSRSGMQLVWIGTSLVLALVLLLLDHRLYDTFAVPIYCVMAVLLFLTIFNPHEIKGSRSWIALGSLRIQPAEFAKFATALAISKVMSSYRFSLDNYHDMLKAIAVVTLPMLLIILQRETGSALVFTAFFLMFYREGMSGSVLFTAFAMVVYFVVGIRYSETPLFGTPSSVGSVVVMLLIQLFLAALLQVYSKSRTRTYSTYAMSPTYYVRNRYPNSIKSTITNALILDTPKKITVFSLCSTVLLVFFSKFIVPFNIVWLQVLATLVILGNLIWAWLNNRVRPYLLIALFGAGSMLFSASTSFILNHVMEPHQRARINVLLGIDKDVTGAGYNVHQSVIAIGSGGLTGKGFLNGTQTKLHFVPEQDTDFIFCTVGEEEGFLGAIVVLSLFLALTLRLMYLADRQPFVFGRVYGYSVASIFLFHLFINVGMVLGITPVIGIPLPFFSYGGSSLWGFTILLFIFLRIDASRHLSHR